MEQDKELDDFKRYRYVYSRCKTNTSKFYHGMVDYNQGLIDDLKRMVRYGEIIKLEVEKFSHPPNHPIICNIALQFSYPVSVAYVFLLTWVKHRAGLFVQGRYDYEGKEIMLVQYAYPENKECKPSDH